MKFIPLVVSLLFPSMACSEQLFYGGDIRSEVTQNQLFSIAGPGESGVGVFDDFLVTAPAWNVSTLSLNVLSPVAQPTNLAQYEIWRGLAEGIEGDLVASSEAISITSAPTGRSVLQFSEIRLTISGLNLELNQGRYWLMIKPFTSLGVGPADASTGVGSPLGNGQTFARSTFLGYNYRSLATLIQPDPYDLSFEIQGTAVPEPASVSTLALAMLLLRRRTRTS